MQQCCTQHANKMVLHAPKAKRNIRNRNTPGQGSMREVHLHSKSHPQQGMDRLYTRTAQEVTHRLVVAHVHKCAIIIQKGLKMLQVIYFQSTYDHYH